MQRTPDQKPMPETSERRTPREKQSPGLYERLRLVFDWHRGMVSQETGRLGCVYHPERDVLVDEGSSVRQIASIWNLAVLARVVGRDDLDEMIDRSLEHFLGSVVSRNGALIFDSARLGEPAGIAHNAFLTLVLLEAEIPERLTRMIALAEGIISQQRDDGSFQTYFGRRPDRGIELYPGQAMLALMTLWEQTWDPAYLASVERGFRHYRDRLPAASIPPQRLVSYANWQAQYGALLHEAAPRGELIASVREYVFDLHDRIIDLGFYDELGSHPRQQATVEVASALEGLNDAYAIAERRRDGTRIDVYGAGIRKALAWLSRAQRLEGATPRERGGFGLSLGDRRQRIDVSGRVASGFIKSLENRFDLG